MTTPTSPWPYNLTPTDGKVAKEKITLELPSGNRPRIIKPKYGAAFADTLVVKDNAGNTLVRGTDYTVTALREKDTVTTAREIIEVVVIRNLQISEFVELEYVPLSSNQTVVDDDLLLAINESDYTKLKGHWGNIANKPRNFAVGDHTHQWYDFYAMNDLVDQLNAMAKVIGKGRIPYYDKLIDAYKAKIAAETADITRIRDELDLHMSDYDRPHAETAETIGYGNLPTLPPSSNDQATTDSSESLVLRYQLDTRVDQKFLPVLYSHKGDFNNPHKTTSQQLGALNYGELGTLLDGYVNYGDKINNANTLNGKPLSEIKQEIGSDIDSDKVNRGRFTTDRIGSGGGDNTKVLTGDGRWTPITEIFDRFGTKGNRWTIYQFPYGWDGSMAEVTNILNNTYGNRDAWPIGAMVIFSYTTRISSNNRVKGNATRRINQLRVAYRADDYSWRIV